MDIALLEKRLAALELQVYPSKQKLEAMDLSKVPPVTDLLLQTNSMTTTALSCREVITSILLRMEAINDYLNPNYSDIQLDVQDKQQYILELYPELKKTVQMISEIEQLKHILDSQQISDIPNLASQLEHLTIKNVNTYNECKSVTDTVLQALQRYNDITLTIKVIFAQIEQAISRIEMSMQSTVAVD